MSKFNEILPAAVPNQEAFILDHGKTVEGSLKYQDDITSYGWNIRRFNKLHKGAFVLSRHPGKLTKDRRFEIYAGGYVEDISEPDAEGNVVAKITHAFTISPPIKQGTDFLDNFVWDSKMKIPGSWEHFWNQYGMNTISYTDFCNLLKDANCIEVKPGEEEDLSEEEVKELKAEDYQGFKVVFEEDGPVRKNTQRTYSGVARHIDFSKMNKAKTKTGFIAETIVMELLSKKAEEEGTKPPVWISKEKGDGAGYDIAAFDSEDREIHVEVKGSRDKYADGFEMTINEVEVSKKPGCKYEVYRIYALDTKTRECKYKVYQGPFCVDNYRMEATSFQIFEKQ